MAMQAGASMDEHANRYAKRSAAVATASSDVNERGESEA